MNKPKQKTGIRNWNGQVSEPAFGLVSETQEVNDQSKSVFMGIPAGSRAPAREPLPLFMDTLYKARDFDPL